MINYVLSGGTGFQPVWLLFSVKNHRLEACATGAILIPVQCQLPPER